MNKNINVMITELVEHDMKDVNKMSKAELKNLASSLLDSFYRELTNETIVELYETPSW